MHIPNFIICGTSKTQVEHDKNTIQILKMWVIIFFRLLFLYFFPRFNRNNLDANVKSM